MTLLSRAAALSRSAATVSDVDFGDATIMTSLPAVVGDAVVAAE
jgi:hypothetical protein